MVETLKAKVKRKKETETERAQLRLKLRSYDSKVMDKSCHQIVEMADRSGVKIVGPIPIPTEFHHYTVNRSSFVHKNAREQFEMRIHKRLVEVINPNQRFMDFLRELTLPIGVDIEVKAI
ncbi:30S ribosomal protein S10 [bacterium (Candidatus Gribaldobacteria) CG_4_10_14_0_8_um_filter_33_9]|uniref:Small ribosomal subunit protein uS10 n=1 Tax=bacterium (Candidatus Gribaldobacteria) CG_4_10_14_0_8_um_filter_33_9 TaxID=2014266 RepID=A0A2M7RP36_9BACT|nr:MAG: 30S ribosomal protein S10 [bacterium (Candidatus Gribaldobacteria) CG_4_10_14_0_8_um_filter_33_9]